MERFLILYCTQYMIDWKEVYLIDWQKELISICWHLLKKVIPDGSPHISLPEFRIAWYQVLIPDNTLLYKALHKETHTTESYHDFPLMTIHMYFQTITIHWMPVACNCINNWHWSYVITYINISFNYFTKIFLVKLNLSEFIMR